MLLLNMSRNPTHQSIHNEHLTSRRSLGINNYRLNQSKHLCLEIPRNQQIQLIIKSLKVT